MTFLWKLYSSSRHKHSGKIDVSRHSFSWCKRNAGFKYSMTYLLKNKHESLYQKTKYLQLYYYVVLSMLNTYQNDFLLYYTMHVEISTQEINLLIIPYILEKHPFIFMIRNFPYYVHYRERSYWTEWIKNEDMLLY